LREALEIRRGAYSAGHPAVVLAQVWLGEALTASGKLNEAQQALEGAMQAARSAPFALAAWRIAEIQTALGMCLAAQGKSAEAKQMLESSEKGLKNDPHAVFRKLSEESLKKVG
jgi:TolA-binding protein